MTLFKTNNEYDAVMLDDEMFVAVPDSRNGDFQIYKGKGLQFDARFHQTGQRVNSAEELVSFVDDLRIHREQLQKLGRVSNPSRSRTPWGAADNVTIYDTGVMLYSTPSHGGFKVYKKINAAIPEPYRNDNGWYEEDCEWAKVAVGLPHLFTDRERRQADNTLKNWFPSAYEAVNGVVLSEEESFIKAQQGFKERHANDFVVIAAAMSNEEKGMVVCTATLGGVRGGYADGVELPTPEERTFLIPKEEYDRRSSFGFVIDLDKHRELLQNEASSFSI